MNPWQAEPLWEFFDRLKPPVRISASDLLAPVVTEYAVRPRRIGTYRGLDMLRSQIRQGVPGVIIRR
jgi:hypothetical protein